MLVREFESLYLRVNRDRIEKEQLVRKFEEILPPLANYKRFIWIVPACMADPVYQIFGDDCGENFYFKPVVVNAKTGWHSEFVYYDDKGGVHRIKEGVAPVKDEWSDYCYLGCCNPQAQIV